MKYTVATEIKATRDRVVALFGDPDNSPKWQRGLRSAELLQGTRGEVGCVTRLVFQMGKRTMEMTETVTHKDLPDAFHGTYDAKGVHNIVRNFFHVVDDGTTRFVSEQEFRFSGFMKVIGLLMRPMFPKQSRNYLADFKTFVEAGKDVSQTGSQARRGHGRAPRSR